MIKHDLENAGIPYKTAEGYADFHASGRHTYITELLRNGVSLPEAKELARHSDIKTTLRYTHIGLDDQAEAVRALPKPKEKPDNEIANKSETEELGRGLGKPVGKAKVRRKGTDPEEEKHVEKKDRAANALHLGCLQGRFVSLRVIKAQRTETRKPIKNKGNDR